MLIGYTFHTLSEGAFSGSKAIAMTRSEAGSVLVHQNFENVTPGTEYTFSAYFKIVEELTSGKFALSIEVYNGNTHLFTERSMDYTVTDGWERAQVSVSLPANATQIRVYAFLDSRAVGTVLVDACQLEQSGAAGQFNMLQNPGMTRTTTAGAVADWLGVGNTALVTSNEHMTGNAASLTGYPGSDVYVYQDIPVSGTAGTTLVFGATALANAASGNPLDENDNPIRSFCAEITLYNGTQVVGTAKADYNRNAMGTVQAIASSLTAEQDFTSVRFKLLYGKQINTALFDDAYLYIDAFGTSYSYDEHGKLILAENDNGDAIGYTYDGANLTRVSQQKNGVEYDYTEYQYDSETDDLLVIFTPGKGKTYLDYLRPGRYKGMPIKMTVVSADGTLASTVTYTYTDDFNYLRTITDEIGEMTEYFYNEWLGIVIAVEDSDGYYSYEYADVCGQLTLVNIENNDVEKNYTYNSNGLLSSVDHNGFAYGFTYDEFGRPVSTTVAGDVLGTYAYNADGTLASMTYGNGVMHSYAYDSLDRITSESYNGIETYAYRYNAAGQLGRHEDYENNVTWLYGYDLVGRLTDVQATDGTRISYAYDDVNKTQSYAVEKNGTSLSSAIYSYTDDGTPIAASVSAQYPDFTYEYDGLKRLSSFEHEINGDIVSTNYDYHAGYEDGTTSSYVSEVEYRYDGYDFGPHSDISYSYNGKNISRIVDGNKQIRYLYDSDDRIIREDNQQLNKTITYTYDTGGNILNKKEYAYTTGTLGEVVDTITYTYDSTWKDKLLTYDGGATITYDEIGNPLTYNGYTFTWQKGRQLASVSGNGNTITYKYGADGLRTQKTVNGVTTDYTYMSGLLVSQTNGTETLNFTYSADGVARSINYNGTDYYYLYNLQGDVITIYDCNGNAVVDYVYDSWGKLISVTGLLATTLGAKNPLRYRGYYYDTETGFYYLTTRYYDPEVCRFINADGYISTGQGFAGFNMFAYCLNNPVNRRDSCGTDSDFVTDNVNQDAGVSIFELLFLMIFALFGTLVYSFLQMLPYVVTETIDKIKSAVSIAKSEIAVIKSVAKTKEKLKEESKNYSYWIAEYVYFGNGYDTYIPTTGLSYTEALNYVRSGGNVFASSKVMAYNLAAGVAKGKPVLESPHGGIGYWYHYHATTNGKTRYGGHIFYV